MKQGHGRLQRADGSVYEGTWDANLIVGEGRVTIAVGDKSKRDGLPKEVRLLSFFFFGFLILLLLFLYTILCIYTILYILYLE